MPKHNHDKIIEAASVLLDQIIDVTPRWTRGAEVRDLAEAFHLVVEATPNAPGDSRRITVHN